MVRGRRHRLRREGDPRRRQGQTSTTRPGRSSRLPLQDALRERQREALVSYLVARPAAMGQRPTRADADDLYRPLPDRRRDVLLPAHLAHQAGDRLRAALRPALSDGARARCPDERPQVGAVELDEELTASGRRTARSGSIRRTGSSPSCATTRRRSSRSSKASCCNRTSTTRRPSRPCCTISKSWTRSRAWRSSASTKTTRQGAARLRPHLPHAAHPLLPAPGRRDRSWTPWEKVELDIEGDHLIPVVWNRKLMLIWPVFTEKAEGKAGRDAGARRKSLIRPTATGKSSWPGASIRTAAGPGRTCRSRSRSQAYQGEDNILFGERVAGSAEYHDDASAQGRTMAICPIRRRIDPGDDDPGDPVPPRPDSVDRAAAPGRQGALLIQGSGLRRQLGRAGIPAARLPAGARHRDPQIACPLRRVPVLRLPQDRHHGAQRPDRADGTFRSPRPARSSIACGSRKRDRALTLFDGSFRPLRHSFSRPCSRPGERARLDRRRSLLDPREQARHSGPRPDALVVPTAGAASGPAVRLRPAILLHGRQADVHGQLRPAPRARRSDPISVDWVKADVAVAGAPTTSRRQTPVAAAMDRQPTGAGEATF